MNSEVKILCNIYAVKLDREGASRVTFEVAQSELPKVMGITGWTEEMLELTIKQVDNTISYEGITNENPNSSQEGDI